MIKLNLNQIDFTAGLVTTLGSNFTPKNGAYKLQNAMVHKGGFRTIPGTSKLNATKIGDLAVKSMYRAYVGSYSCLIVTAGTNMYYWDTVTSAFISIKDTLTSNSFWSFVTYNGYIYATNGIDTPLKITLTADAPTVANMSGGPGVTTGIAACKQFLVARERVFAMGNAVNPDRVWYCSKGTDGIGLPETWVTTQYLSFPNQSANERVVGGGVWNGNPVIFTENSISLWLGDTVDEFDINTTDRTVGCVSQYSISQWGADIIFLGRKGVYLFCGGQAHLLSGNILPQIEDINVGYINQAVGISDENCYYLSYVSTLAGGTVPNRMLILDKRIGNVIDGILKAGWTGVHTIGARSLVWFYGASDNGELYYGDATSTGFVWKFMDTTAVKFGTTTIVMDVEASDIDFKDVGIKPDDKMTFDKLTLTAEPVSGANGSIQSYYYLDNSSTSTSLGSAISLLASGRIKGDVDDTTATRTLITYPTKIQGTAGVPISGYSFRPRWNCQSTDSVIVVRGYGIESHIKS